MKKNITLFSGIFIVLVSILRVNGQDRVVLVNNKSPSKERIIDHEEQFSLMTQSSIVYDHNYLLRYTDSTMTFVNRKKAPKDTIIDKNNKVRAVKNNIYFNDTITISFNELTQIKLDRFKDKAWMEGFAWIGLGAVMGVAILPVAAIDGGTEAVKDWAVFEVILLAISVPPILIGGSRIKYDLSKKWRLKVINPKS